MTSNEIKQAALKLFVKNGFHGTSLMQIADEVGIKKQSIYAHFKGKDDLYLNVLEEALAEECLFAQAWVQQQHEQTIDHVLYQFLQMYFFRYASDESFKLGLRMSFYPPDHLNQAVKDKLLAMEKRFILLLQPIFQIAIDKKNIHITQADTGVYAFLSMLDAVCVELVYNNSPHSNSKINASWEIYWRGLSTP